MSGIESNATMENANATSVLIQPMINIFSILLVVFACFFVISKFISFLDLDISFADLFTKRKCGKCGKKHLKNQFKVYKYKLYCPTCAAKVHIKCSGCSKKFSLDKLNDWEDSWYCSACYEKYYRQFEEIKHNLKFYDSQTFNKNPFKEYCGVEVECRNRRRNKNCFIGDETDEFKINQYTDGSLNSGGVEFSTQPINGDLLFDSLEKFSNKLKLREYFTDSSCGCHVHISTPKDDLDLLKKILIFYRKFEGYFMKAMPSNRRSNSFCNSTSKYYKFSDSDISLCKDLISFKKMIYNDTYVHDPKNKYDGTRYCWINLHSIFHRETMEIRLHPGTIESDKINKWLLIHLKIRSFLNNNSIKDIINLKANDKEFFGIIGNSLKKYIQKRTEFFNNPLKKEKDFEVK